MSNFSLSFHEDTTFNIDHDNRKHLSRNVIPERVAGNVSYSGNIPIEQFYEETFQKAYEEFKQKQIAQRHGDKVKNWPATYYERVIQEQAEKDKAYREELAKGTHKKDLRGKNSHAKVARQIIVQIGNTDDVTNENLDIEEQNEMKKQMTLALKKYMETFQQENPNFRIVNAVIHVDEIGETPHLHLTYVPVAYNQSRGIKTSNSLEAALKAMGITSDKKKQPDGTFETAQTKWQMKERDRAIEIAAEFGLDAGYTKGSKAQHLDIHAYRELKHAEREARVIEILSVHSEERLERTIEAIAQNEQTIAENEKTINQQEYDIKQMDVSIQEQEEHFDAVAEDLSNKIKELHDVSKKIETKTKELEDVNDIADTIWTEVDRCKEGLQKVVLSSPNHKHDYVTFKDSAFGPKRSGYLVPERDYEILTKRNQLTKEYANKFVVEFIDTIKNALMRIPGVAMLMEQIRQLQEENAKQKQYYRDLQKRYDDLEKKFSISENKNKVNEQILKTQFAPNELKKLRFDAERDLAKARDDDDILR